MSRRRTASGWVLAAGLAAGMAVAALPTSGTAAAWNDQAAVTSPVWAATSVPQPTLSCAQSDQGVVVSWPYEPLPGPRTPAVEHLARVKETGAMLTVSGTQVRSATVTPASVTPATNGETRTVQVRASVDFGSTTWVTIAVQQVVVIDGRGGYSVSCA